MHAPSIKRTAALATLAALTLAFRPPAPPPYPDFDKRAQHAPIAAEKNLALDKLRQTAPDAVVQFNEITHTVSHVTASRGFLSGPNGRERGISDNTLSAFRNDDPHRATKVFLQQHRALFGHGPEALDTAKIKRDHTTPHNHLRTLVWEQHIHDIPIFEALLISHTTARGELVSLSSQFLPDATLAPQRAKARPPTLSAPQAVEHAARNLDIPLNAQNITLLDKAAGAQQHHRFHIPQLVGDTTAELVWLPTSHDQMRLCWDVILKVRSRGEVYRAIVDTETGAIILRRCLTTYLTNSTYRVYTGDSPSPFSPGHPTPLVGQPPLAERSLLTLTALNTNASPNGWIDDAVNETRGNNVDAHLDRNDNDQPDLPRPQGSPFHTFDFPLDLTQDPRLYGNAAAVQLFYWNNFMHDKLYELGFTEAAGNFQVNNFGRGGAGNDPVQADAQDGGGTDNANMYTPPDGQPARMQMYLFGGPDPDRDGDYDAEVVLHEYTHGLSNRRVGGGAGISALQTQGMGEGWSDFYALALLSEPGDDINGNYAAGAYLTYQFNGFSQNYYSGIRRYPYSTDMTKNPLTFRDIDPAQASSHGATPQSPVFGGGGADEVHNQGEVWCVALWEARANLIAKHGWTNGNHLILQLVTDGMNLSPPNPTFLQARDAILQADQIDNGGANRPDLWAAFAKRGMGASATSPSSSTTTGLREAFDLPDDLNVTPNEGFVVSGPVGGPFPPTAKMFALRNAGSNTITWTAFKSVTWLDVSVAGGLLETGATLAVNVSLNSTADAMPMGIYDGTVSFTNVNSGIGQSRSFRLRIGQPDYFTELFDGDLDLSYSMFTFKPDGSTNSYSVCREAVTNFPSDPAGGNIVTLTDDSFVQIFLMNGSMVSLFGHATNYVEIGSNGYLTFGGGDTDWNESIGDHFSRQRISALFRDLFPVNGNGRVSWAQLTNRLVVTFENVPEYGRGNTNSFQIECFYDGRIRITYLQIDATRGLAGLSRGLGTPFGFDDSDFSRYDPCVAPLRLAPIPALTEGNGTVNGVGLITLPFALSTNITVMLASSDTGELTVPWELIIPAGETNGFFDLTVIDDTELDGTQSATITATAPGFAPAVRVISVNDNEAATLTIFAPSDLNEGLGETQVIVAVSAPVGANVVVHLASSDLTELQVPANVIIPAGQTSAVFALTVVDDTEIDGSHQAIITATVTNWSASQAAVIVHDNESTDLRIFFPATQVYENAGPLLNYGSVLISGTLTTNLIVSLTSSDVSELVVPATVTIPPGQTAAPFTVWPEDDNLVDGMQFVVVSANATAFSAGSNTLAVLDDESPPPPFNPMPVHQASNVVASVALSWTAGTNTTNDVYFGTNPAPGPAERVGTTTGTAWTLPLLAPATTYYWQVVSHRIGSTPGPVWSFTTRGVHHFLFGSVGATQYVGVPFSVAITAQDEFNTTVSNFSGVVQLHGQSGSGEVLHTGFEQGLDGFVLDNSFGRSNGLWHLSTARASQPGHSASASLYYGHNELPNGNGDYDNGLPNEGVATSPLLNLASVLPPVSLTFQHLIQTELSTNWDRTTIEISTNDGASYSLLAARFLDDSFPYDSAGLWLTQAVDLTSFAAGEARLRFHFDSLDSSANGYEGWFIDDVVVRGQAFPLAIAPLSTTAFLNGSWMGQVSALAQGTNVSLVAVDGSGHEGVSSSFEVIGGPQVWILRAADSVIVNWTALAGRTYRVETKSDLESAWSSGGAEVTATKSVASATNILATAQKFYRVVLLP